MGAKCPKSLERISSILLYNGIGSYFFRSIANKIMFQNFKISFYIKICFPHFRNEKNILF